MEETQEAQHIEVGNFVIREFWGDVECKHEGHEVRLINVGRSHYAVCDKCETFIWLGSNLSSSWRYENETIWQKNAELLERYKFADKENVANI
jgi:hypothetical protein